MKITENKSKGLIKSFKVVVSADEFKTAYGSSMEALSNALKRAFPNYTKVQCEKFIYVFMPFMNGIYPYTFITEKQSKAIEKSETKFKQHTVSEIVCNAILKILENE